MEDMRELTRGWITIKVHSVGRDLGVFLGTLENGSNMVPSPEAIGEITEDHCALITVEG